MILFLALSAAGSQTVHRRLVEFLHPEGTALMGLTQSQLATRAIRLGGMLGQGVQGKTVGYATIPLAASDFTLAQFAYVYGLLPTVFVIISLWLLIDEMIRVAGRLRDGAGIALACPVYLGLRAVLHVASNVGIAPVCGIPCPFISIGGTALTCAIFAVALLLGMLIRKGGSEDADQTGEKTPHRTLRIFWGSLMLVSLGQLLWVFCSSSD